MDGDVRVAVAGDERAASALAAVTAATVESLPVSVTPTGDEESPTGAGRDERSKLRQTTDERAVPDDLAADVVVVAGTTPPSRLLSAADRTGAPVVAYADDQPTAAWVDGFVRRTDGEPDAERLRAAVARALAGETRVQLRRRRRRLSKVHDGAATLAAARSESELAERCVEVAHDALSPDDVAVLADRGGWMERVAGTPGVGSERATDAAAAVARETLAAGTPRIVTADGHGAPGRGAADESNDDADREPDPSDDTDADRELVPTDDERDPSDDTDADRELVPTDDERDPSDDGHPDEQTDDAGGDDTENGERRRATLSVPIGDDAVLQATATDPDGFDATDLEAAELLATHARETRERLDAEASARTRRERIATLHEAATDLIDADTETAVLARTVEIATDVLELDHCVLAEATDDGFYARAVETDLLTAGERLADDDEGLLAVTHRAGESLVEGDLRESTHAEPADDTFAAAVSVPFPGVGVFQAVSLEPDTYDETDRELAELLVSYASTTVERIRSATALRESNETVERLYEAAAEVAAAETETEVGQRAITAAGDVLSLDRCALSLADEERGRFVPIAASDDAEPAAMRIDEGLAGRTYHTGETVVVDDLHADADATPTDDAYRSAISVPVGELGVFQAVATETGAFDRTDADRTELLMAHVAVALGRVRARAGLREERDRFSALFENIPDAVVSFELVDGDPIVKAVNTAFEETFGYDEDRVSGENIDEFVAPAGDDFDTPAGELNRRLRDGENLRLEVRRRTAEGPRDFLLYVVPLELDAENVGGFAIYSDITERKERERALRRQNERLDEFASVVSHDLRNPISIADGYLEMARETGDEAHFDKVRDAVDRMDALVADLLELAREGEVVGDPEPVAVTDVADTAWRHVDTADATLDLQGAVTVEADADRLTELFENLFRNAVEHAGRDAAVWVVPTADGFVVADDGPGIPAGEREAIFEPGMTTSENGTGFGLPIVRRIAEAHGWSVTVGESEAGGARFEFRT